MITTNDLKNGMTLNYEDALYEVLYFQHVKPGKGGAFVRTKLRNLYTGANIEKTFRAGEKVEQEIIETEPGAKGDTVSQSFKPAVIETGAKIQVPIFINEGDIIKIDTRTGEY